VLLQPIGDAGCTDEDARVVSQGVVAIAPCSAQQPGPPWAVVPQISPLSGEATLNAGLALQAWRVQPEEALMSYWRADGAGVADAAHQECTYVLEVSACITLRRIPWLAADRAILALHNLLLLCLMHGVLQSLVALSVTFGCTLLP